MTKVGGFPEPGIGAQGNIGNSVPDSDHESGGAMACRSAMSLLACETEIIFPPRPAANRSIGIVSQRCLAEIPSAKLQV